MNTMSGTNNSWVNYSDLDLHHYSILLTGFSLFGTIITQPLNVVSTRQQALPKQYPFGESLNLNIIKSTRYTINSVGYRGLFRGLWPVLILGIPSDVGYASAIESSREALQVPLKKTFPSVPLWVIDGFQSAVSGIVATFLSLIPYNPAEVVSTRMMIQDRSGLTMMQTVRLIYKENKIKGLYRGFNSSFAFGVFSSFQFWWTYSICRRESYKIEALKEKPILLDSLCGFIAGLSATVVSHPLDTVKVRIMANKGRHFDSVSKVTCDIIKREGWRTLFRGLPASALATSISSVGFATVYEMIKRNSVVT